VYGAVKKGKQTSVAAGDAKQMCLLSTPAAPT
jgi:hypothetical protein